MVKSASSNPPGQSVAPRPGSTIPRPAAGRAIPLPSGKKVTSTPAPALAVQAVKIPAAPAVPKIDEGPATAKTTEEPAVVTVRTVEEPVVSTAREPSPASVTKVELAPPTAPLGAMMEAPVALVPTKSVAPAPVAAPAVVAAPAPAAVAAPAPVVAPPPVASPVVTAPMAFVPPPPANLFAATAEGRGPTLADDVEIELAEDVAAAPPVAATLASPLLALPVRAPMVSLPDPSPSKEALLERAAALGPPRMTWASFVPTSDPVLEAKMKPQIAERRARFQKIVKGTLAACGAMCLVALIVTAVSGGEPTAKAASREGATKTAPAKIDGTVTTLAGAKRSKAVRTAAPAVTTAVAMPRAKRR